MPLSPSYFVSDMLPPKQKPVRFGLLAPKFTGRDLLGTGYSVGLTVALFPPGIHSVSVLYPAHNHKERLTENQVELFCRIIHFASLPLWSVC